MCLVTISKRKPPNVAYLNITWIIPSASRWNRKELHSFTYPAEQNSILASLIIKMFLVNKVYHLDFAFVNPQPRLLPIQINQPEIYTGLNWPCSRMMWRYFMSNLNIYRLCNIRLFLMWCNVVQCSLFQSQPDKIKVILTFLELPWLSWFYSYFIFYFWDKYD